MSRREDFTDAYGRREKPEQELEGDFSRFRKKSYEKYFEGYTVEKFSGPDGKLKKYRVYTGDLFRPELDAHERRRLKLVYGSCLCAALLMNIVGLLLPAESNSNIVAFSFGCIPLAFYIRMLFAFGTCASSEADLKIYEYNYGARALLRSARPALIAAAAALAASAVTLIACKSAFSIAELIRMLMLAASGLLAGAVGAREKAVKYERISGRGKEQK